MNSISSNVIKNEIMNVIMNEIEGNQKNDRDCEKGSFTCDKDIECEGVCQEGDCEECVCEVRFSCQILPV